MQKRDLSAQTTTTTCYTTVLLAKKTNVGYASEGSTRNCVLLAFNGIYYIFTMYRHTTLYNFSVFCARYICVRVASQYRFNNSVCVSILI